MTRDDPDKGAARVSHEAPWDYNIMILLDHCNTCHIQRVQIGTWDDGTRGWNISNKYFSMNLVMLNFMNNNK